MEVASALFFLGHQIGELSFCGFNNFVSVSADNNIDEALVNEAIFQQKTTAVDIRRKQLLQKMNFKLRMVCEKLRRDNRRHSCGSIAKSARAVLLAMGERGHRVPIKGDFVACVEQSLGFI